MKKTSIFLTLIVASLLLAACSGSAPAAQNAVKPGANQPAQVEVQQDLNSEPHNEQPAAAEIGSTPMPVDFATFFSLEYENALSARNQLAIGMLKLAETSYPISAEQSQQLLPLWQAILALESDPGTAAQELNAVQNQILLTLSNEQREHIRSKQFNNDDMIAVYNELGLTIQVNGEGTTMGTGRGNGMGGGAGAGQDTVAREATRTAAEALGTPVGEGGGQGQANKNQMTQAIIDYLTALIGD